MPKHLPHGHIIGVRKREGIGRDGVEQDMGRMD